MAIAPMLILRFGDNRSVSLLRKCFHNPTEEFPSQCVRAAAIVYAGYGHDQAKELRQAASRLLRNHLSELVRMIDAIEAYEEVPKRFLQRVNLSFDALVNQQYVDMRTLVVARLLGLNRNAKVKHWLADRRRFFLSEPLSSFDQALIQRLWPPC
jgi:hypothetical protein